MEYTTRGVCGQEGCRETRYYLDNGLWFCRRGHQQEGRQVEEDPEDFGTQGKLNRLKKDATEKGTKRYRGQRAYRLFLQIYQLILWKQCYALIHDRGFPSQTEEVVRDLWALRLDTFSEKLAGPAESTGDEPEVFSSQPSAPETEDDEAFKLSHRRTTWPRLIDSVGLCYLGALLLRLPVTIADMHRMIMREEIPFIRIIKSIPREMRDKLPQTYLSILETKTIMKAEQLHHAVRELVFLYDREFGVIFPPLNAPLILFKYIKYLSLPVEVYPAVKRLRGLLGFTCTFPTDGKVKRRCLHLPEVQMISIIVVATKLYFPFDNVKRYPTSAKEPAAQVIDWKVWGQAQRQFDNRETAGGRIGKGNEIMVNEKDVLNMTESQLDEYMDWYENSWLDSNNAQNQLAEMFPLGRTGLESQPPATSQPDIDDDEAIAAKLQTVMNQMKPRRAISEEDALKLPGEVPRPGSLYQRYRRESDLPETARMFYEAAAKVAGISLPNLIRAVHQTELKLERWQENKRRMEYYGKLQDEEFTKGADDEMEVGEQGVQDF